MDENTRKKLIERWEKERDTLQGILQEVRKERVERSLETRKELRRHSVRFAELSFGLGAALVPLFFIADKLKDIELLVFISSGLFVLSGLIGFFREKTELEGDSSVTPDIGLDSEIAVYPMVNALNKLIDNPENEEYQDEYFKSTKSFLDKYAGSKEDEDKVDFRLDIQYGLALTGILLIFKTAWPFPSLYFWFLSLAVLIIFGASVYSSTKSVRARQAARREKLQKLYEIRKEFMDWLEREFPGRVKFNNPDKVS